MFSYNQHGSVYSCLYSCSLGYFSEFVILTVISVEIIYFEGRCYCFFWGGGVGIKRFGNYLNKLIKILVCGADDITLTR